MRTPVRWSALAALTVLGVATADFSVSLPVNLTALRPGPPPSVDDLRALGRRMYQGVAGLLANASVDCDQEGQPCVPDNDGCCEGLRCEEAEGEEGGEAGRWSCRGLTDSDDEAADRLDSLGQQGRGPLADSHPWAYSWEFQSKSDMEREELAEAEEAEWKKNWKPKEGKEGKWAKLKEKIEQRAKKAWQDVKTWKKLNELKGKIIDTYKEKITKKESEDKPEDVSKVVEVKERPKEEEAFVTERTERRLKEESNEDNFFANILGHKGGEEEEVVSVEKSGSKAESDESVIKFSDETSKKKRQKKIDFRIDDIIKQGVDMIADKIRAKEKDKHGNKVELSPGNSLEKQLYEHEEIDDTEDKLMKEIEELKKLRKGGGAEERRGENDNVNDEEEVIRRQVAAILDEERRLERLRKMEELKRMEQGGVGLANNRVA